MQPVGEEIEMNRHQRLAEKEHHLWDSVRGRRNLRPTSQTARTGHPYLQTRLRRTGAQAALDRCRALARQIQSDLLNKKADDFVDLLALADLQVSIECAASVLGHSKGEW
jgi:hypothetical protein